MHSIHHLEVSEFEIEKRTIALFRFLIAVKEYVTAEGLLSEILRAFDI